MRKVAIGCLLFAAASIASAWTTYTFITNGNSTTGQVVSAEADFTFGLNTLTLTLSNLLVNPTDVAQNITDFQFTVASTTMGGTISSSSGPAINVASNGTFTSAGTVNPINWSFTPSAGGVFKLEGLGVMGAPAYSIIGAPNASNVYSNANGSIAGNDPHNPFLYETATWVFNIQGVTSLTPKPTGVIFSFGTQMGEDFYSCADSGCVAPEPSSWLLLGSGLVGLAFFAHRAARKKTA